MREIRVFQLLPTIARGDPGYILEALVKNIDNSQFESTCCSMYAVSPEKEIIIPGHFGIQNINLNMKQVLESGILLTLNNLIKQNRFDIIHIHVTRAYWYGRVVAQVNGVSKYFNILA